MKTIKFHDTHDYGFEVPALSRRDLTLDAHDIHKLLGYKGNGPFPIMVFIERVLPTLFDEFDLVIETEQRMGDNLGITYPREQTIVLREDIYDAAACDEPFARMTAAHEVGHLLEHRDVPLLMALRSVNGSMPAYRSSEWQANAFAGALLMPACKIIDMDEQDVASRYLVTISAARCQTQAMRKEARRWPLPQL